MPANEIPEMTVLRRTILDVMTGQSPDYFIYPNAAAFAARGLDPADVQVELDAIEAEGAADREQCEIIVQTSDEVYLALTDDERAALDGAMPPPVTEVVAGGWRLTQPVT